jgi:hypothetical protein
MIKLRRAIKSHAGISAECPVEGDCQGTQVSQGKMITFTCLHYVGTQEKEDGLHVHCSYAGPECKN